MALTIQKLRKIIKQFLDVQTTDSELIVLRKLFDKMDEKTAIKLASTSMDSKILCDLIPSIGCSWPKARKIAKKRLKNLFPDDYERHRREQEETLNTIRSMFPHR